MKALVTGAAGFVGSSIVDRLLSDGHEVVGVDCFTPYYSRSAKENNLLHAREQSQFSFVEMNLATENLEEILEGVTNVFHQAGQPGVRASWGKDFLSYVQMNIWATQQLLEAVKNSPTVKSFVAASSSSVYGAAEKYPTNEEDLPRPISPYGVTKLASEHLCTLYGNEFGVPTVSLRYFTVYGPRQRPDMAMSRVIQAGLQGSEFFVFGDGLQARDFTYIEDVVEANLQAAEWVKQSEEMGESFNVGGNRPATIREVIGYIEQILQKNIGVKHIDREDGDPVLTGANISKIVEKIGWRPSTSIKDGLLKQITATNL
jgi:nucleoside-diphosphate-sugar epimerase